MRPRRDRRERGSVAPFVAVLVVLTALGATAVAQLGGVAAGRARVEAHADVAALAAVGDGPDAASAALAYSGARLVDSTTHPDGARTVVVELDGLRARATAAPGGERFGMIDEP